jgi:ATP-binding cassette subfamily F protein 3
LRKLAPQAREQDLRNYLGSFNFPGEMATDPVEHFSGGEKARLALALIVWQKPNLLLLDEPTNHLDLDTREALAVALAQFEGTLVLVSHDRHLLRATTDQFLIVANGAVQAFDGDLEDYREWLLKRNVLPSVQKKPVQKPVKAKPANRKPPEARIKRLEELMARLNARKGEIETRLADPGIYQDAASLNAALADQAYVTREIEQVETEWLQKQAELEQS